MQVEPIKHKLKAPGSMLLKLRCDGSLSNVAFKFNLRRYVERGGAERHRLRRRGRPRGRVLHSSTSQLNLSRVCRKKKPYTP